MPKITLKILLWTQHMNSENRAQGSIFVTLVPLEAELSSIRSGAYLCFRVDERAEEQTKVQVLLLGESPEEPGRLQSMGSQRVRHNLVAEQQ